MDKSFLASMDNLREILHFIRQEIKMSGFEGSSGSQLELALEEAIVNIIKYAYPSSEGEIAIQCESLGGNGIRIVLIDNGIPFNPTSKVSQLEIEEINKGLPQSGYGIFLIFRIMDTVEYEFKSGCNILTLTKRL